MTAALSSWQDSTAKRTILDFVARVTDRDYEGYVRPVERVAVFDNDGTLWCEQPVIQGLFILRRLVAMAEQDASLRKTQPWKAAYEKDDSWINQAVTKHYSGDDADLKALIAAVLKAFGGETVEAFAGEVGEFFRTERHPVYDRSYLQVGYVPMVELLAYLEANDFTCYIVSGGGRDFMRPVTQTIYDIPPERVIGSAPEMKFQADEQGANVIRRGGLDILDDGPGKPIQIWDRTGRRPILATGNANGDIPMLQFAGDQKNKPLCLLVHHDDTEREVAYEAGAEQALKAAAEHGWTVVSMKNDWKQVFSFQEG